MTERNHDNEGRRILKREGFGQHLEEEDGVSIRVVKEAYDLIAEEVIAFLLGERVPEKNIFAAYMPEELGDDVVITALKTEGRDRYLFFSEDTDAPDSVSVELRQLVSTSGEADIQDVFEGDLLCLVILAKSKIVKIEFEILEKEGNDLAVRSVLIASEGGYFVRIPDNGMIESWNVLWDDSADE